MSPDSFVTYVPDRSSGTLTRSIGVQGLANADALTLSRKRARTVMTSGGQEPVSEVGGGTHSVFAKAFLDALADNRGHRRRHDALRENAPASAAQRGPDAGVLGHPPCGTRGRRLPL